MPSSHSKTMPAVGSKQSGVRDGVKIYKIIG
jgi:hypothetical protein